jgi:hypothetical protein
VRRATVAETASPAETEALAAALARGCGPVTSFSYRASSARARRRSCAARRARSAFGGP